MSTTPTIKKLALDMIPVFLAVFLAYQVNEYRDYRQEQKNLLEAIKNIRLELVHNKAQADSSAMYHAEMIRRIDIIRSAQDSGEFKGYKNFMHFLGDISPKKRNLVLPRLSDISLETAKRKNAMSSMDYQTVNKISSVYVNMNEGLKNTQKILLNYVSDPDVMTLTDFERTLNFMYGSIRELYTQEIYLSKQIDMTLTHLTEIYP